MPELQERTDALRDLGYTPTLREIDMTEVNKSEVARKTGYHLSMISRVLNGVRSPSFWCAIKIAEAMSITTDELAFNIMKGKVKKSDLSQDGKLIS